MPLEAPQDALSWAARARVAEQVGDAEEAARSWAWVARLDAGSVWAWLAVGRSARERGDLEAAAAALDRAAGLAPDLPEVHLERGRWAVAAGQPAVSALRAAAEGGAAEAWPEALAASGGDAGVLDAWLAAEVPPRWHDARADAAAAAGRWADAALERARAMAWVPSVARLEAWASASARACDLDPVRAWLDGRRPEGWGPSWASAAAAARAARCAP